jgi:hypothetical protein
MKHAETRVLSPRLSADDPAVRRVARAPEPVSPASGPDATVRRRVLNRVEPRVTRRRRATRCRGKTRRTALSARASRSIPSTRPGDARPSRSLPPFPLSLSDPLRFRRSRLTPKNAARNADLEDVFRRVAGLLRRARLTRPAWKRARGAFPRQRDHHEPLHRA